ncbi:MAG: tRNA (adenosine(37)-N6)-threonylcarbamoyltransferase complex ATPase subunit type 1 TsaE [Muribaculaceae bacterium]|nr:tRNA (adenosine(37)-N6)-threonylcarbamoyltransferase complex ATPase subunit type 1 TsaE [Muribaculaceae bacterium]
MQIAINNASEIARAAKEFIDAMGGRKIFAFYGEMGVGKTTFISEVCRQLGVDETANSPSFSIANEYRAEPSGERIYHFDFYRLESPQEALDLGAEDYFYSGDLCLIEWPEMIGDLLPEDAVRVEITADHETGARTVSFD